MRLPAIATMAVLLTMPMAAVAVPRPADAPSLKVLSSADFPVTISRPGYYVLSEPVFTPPGGIEVLVNGVTIDLGGHSLTGTFGAVVHAAPDVTRTTLRNGTVVLEQREGPFAVDLGAFALVENLSVQCPEGAQGIRVGASSIVRLVDVSGPHSGMASAGHAIAVGSDSVVEQVHVTTSGFGITGSGVLRDSTVQGGGSGAPAIIFSGVIENCRVSRWANGPVLRLGSDSIVRSNRFRSAYDYRAVELNGTHVLFEDNVLEGGSQCGQTLLANGSYLSVSRNQFIGDNMFCIASISGNNNEIHENHIRGQLRIGGNENVVRSNNVLHADTVGLLVTGTDNLVVENTVSGREFGYPGFLIQIAPGNDAAPVESAGSATNPLANLVVILDD